VRSRTLLLGIKRISRFFLKKNGTWTGVAQNEWYKENPQLLAELPANLKSQEFNLEVSDRLQQLSIALISVAIAFLKFRYPN